MKSFLLVCTLVAGLFSVSAQSARADGYKLDDARISIIGTGTDDSGRSYSASGNWGLDENMIHTHLFSNRVKFPAQIQITEVDGQLDTRETIIPVVIKLEYVGVPWKAGETRGVMGFHNLKGKTLGDLLGEYVGGELSIGAILNLGEMALLKKGGGVWINDVQTLVVGLGVNATKVRAIVATEDTKDVVITVTDSGNKQTQQQNASLTDVLSQKLN